MGQIMICIGDWGVCCSAAFVMYPFQKPRIVERGSYTYKFELLQQIQACGRFSSNHRDTKISPDKVRFAFTPNKPCWFWRAPHTKAWNALSKSGWQGSQRLPPRRYPKFSSLEAPPTPPLPKRSHFPLPPKLSGGRFDRAAPWESPSFRPKPPSYRVVDQVALTGMLLLSHSLWKWLQNGATGLRGARGTFHQTLKRKPETNSPTIQMKSAELQLIFF